MGDATRLTLAMRRFASRFFPAKRLSRFLSRPISETLPEGRRRFAILNIPRHLFSEATGAAARRRANTRLQE